jgi:hypothetical protein
VLMDMKILRSTIGEGRDVRVFPAFNMFGHRPLFVALPKLVSVQSRLAVCDGNQLYIRQCRSGWVPGPVFCEFAECLCQWVDAWRVGRGARREGRENGRQREACCFWSMP